MARLFGRKRVHLTSKSCLIEENISILVSVFRCEPLNGWKTKMGSMSCRKVRGRDSMKVDRTEQTEEAGADVPKVTMKSEIYSISELANEFDVTSRAIRFYEDQGLLNPSRKGRKRIYQERDRVRLKLILRGKRLGFSLADIKEIFDLYDSAPGEEGQLNYLIDIIQTRRAQLEQQRQDIDVVLDEMRWVEKRAKKALRDLQEGKE